MQFHHMTAVATEHTNTVTSMNAMAAEPCRQRGSSLVQLSVRECAIISTIYDSKFVREVNGRELQDLPRILKGAMTLYLARLTSVIVGH